MLRKLIQDEQPKYIAAIFESKEKTFRHEAFSDYKANREQMPDDLASQMPYIKRLCEAYNVPMISLAGFEADDVIGALAIQAADQGLQSVIVSNDKDMCQLVRDPLIVCMRQNSQVIKRKEPVPPIEWCDEAWVEKKFGVSAGQVVDLLGLMGDSVDNIPGAPGIGSKGAVQLIQTFGSIENALERWEEVKHKTYRESLRNNADLIRQSRELARIRTDVEVQLDLNELERRPPDRAAAYELFRELEFTALTTEFSDGAVAAATVAAKRQYSIVRKRATALLTPLGIELAGVADDTLIAAYVIDPTRSKYELIDLARETVGAEGGGPAYEGWSESGWQAAEVADLTAQVARVLRQRIEEKDLGSIYREIELPLAPMLYRMEQAGIRVDLNVLNELSHRLGEELAKLTNKICQLAGREFNINSPKQVAECFESLNIVSGRKTSTGRVSTSKAVLEELAQTYQLPRLIIEYRELDKLKSVYTDALPHQIAADGRIHGQLNQTVAATGRLSSSEPNLQNIPIRTELGRRIRRAFVAEPGNKLISADYSQLELRLLAHITRDQVMLEAFQNGEDIHARTARLVFNAKTDEELKEARRFAKIVNFAIAYAIEPWGLSQRVGISRQEARKVIDA